MSRMEKKKTSKMTTKLANPAKEARLKTMKKSAGTGGGASAPQEKLR